jgi:hypothetical protein
LNRSGWYTHDCLTISDVSDNSCPSSNDTIVSNSDAWDHDGPDTDKRAVTDFDLSGKAGTGGEVDTFSQHTIMVDAGSCIDDTAEPNDSVGLDDGPCHDEGARLQSRRRGHNGGRMNQR